MSSSGIARVAGAETSAKNSRVPWGTGAKSASASVLSGNGGMAAAVFSPGGPFVESKKIEKVTDINHFYVSLAHAHSSVLKVTAPAPALPLNPPAPIPDRVVRELGHEADVRMPARSQGETRAMQDSHHSMAKNLANREVIDEAFREHGLLRTHIDLPTAPASDLSAPSTVDEAEASEHANIWRGSRAREFSGLKQAH